MATKPTTTTPIFASDSVYSVGPKVGRLTKSTDFGAALATQGHVPGKNFPTSANEFNAWLNTSAFLTNWVFDGETSKNANAHVVETNAAGTLLVNNIDIGNTSSSIGAATIRNNAVGSALDIIANNSRAVEITSNNTTTGAPESILITNTRISFASWMFIATTTGGADSIGGIRIETSSDTLLATSGVQPREQAAINALNAEGTAVEAINAGIQPAMRALNTTNASVSLKAGFGNDDSVASNFGGTAILAEAGFGNAGAGIVAGQGINARGGDAANGTIDVPGGAGVFGKGGLSMNLPGGPGVHAQSTGNNSTSLLVEHESASASADLAKFETKDNTANGIVVDCKGFGNAAKLDAQGGAGLFITQTPEGVGGIIFPHVTLIPQTAPSTGPDVTDSGDMWTQFETAGPEQLRYATGNERQFVSRGLQAFCAVTHFQNISVGGPAGPSSAFLELATFSFNFAMRPTESLNIILKAIGTFQVTSTLVNAVVETRWVDVTAAVNKAVKVFDFASSATALNTDGHHIIQTSVPAGGARTYKLEFRNLDPAGGSLVECVNWWFEAIAEPQ